MCTSPTSILGGNVNRFDQSLVWAQVLMISVARASFEVSPSNLVAFLVMPYRFVGMQTNLVAK